MRSSSKYVDVKNALVNFIEKSPGLDYKIN